MSSTPGPAAPRRRRPAALAWVVGAVALAVVALAAVWLVGLGQDDDGDVVAGDPTPVAPTPTATTLRAPDAALGRCLPPGVDLLRAQEVAFAGWVEEVTPERVLLRVERTYAGDVGETVEVEAPAAAMTRLVGAAQFVEDELFLVAAADGVVTVCGASGPAEPRLERLYERAFG